MCVYMCVCVYIYIYIYICAHTCGRLGLRTPSACRDGRAPDPRLAQMEYDNDNDNNNNNNKNHNIIIRIII